VRPDAATLELRFFCANSPSWCVTICGDGLIGGPEECDDGARDSADGCSASCKLEPNAIGQGEPSRCTGR
jgi:cysteine-rich repeat protein